MLHIRDLQVAYGGFLALNGVSIDIAAGECVGLLGPSGCGKTSLLRAVAGLVPVSHGSILLDDADISPQPVERRGFSMLFQQFALFPNMTVRQNVAYPMKIRRKFNNETIRARVDELLRMVQLQDRGDSSPSQLSGGQQQRVALARALAADPKLLLLDEPLSALDAVLREELRVEIRSIQQRLGLTTIFVTHDQSEALSMCDRVAVMDKGGIVQLGRPDELYDLPSSRFVAEFIGRANIFSGGTVVGPSETGDWRYRHGNSVFGASRYVGDNPTAYLCRPESVLIHRSQPDCDTTRNAIKAEVIDLAYRGPHCEVVGHTELGKVIAVEPGRSGYRQLNVGESIWFSWSSDDAIIFTV